MKPSEYMILAMRTNAPQRVIQERIARLPIEIVQLDNAVRGLANEVGELSDITKRVIEYGGPVNIDRVNVREELGDVLWRVAQAASACGLTLEECMEANIDKLRTRYPNLYTDTDALHRNLAEERDTLKNYE